MRVKTTPPLDAIHTHPDLESVLEFLQLVDLSPEDINALGESLLEFFEVLIGVDDGT